MDEDIVQNMREVLLSGLDRYFEPDEHQRGLKCLKLFENSREGWRLCIEKALRPDSGDNARFFCLQVLEVYLRQRFFGDNLENKAYFRSFIHSWLHNVSGFTSQFVQNKFAQIVALAFLMEYPDYWPRFFEDLFAASTSGDSALLVLRVLKAINDEIGDDDIPRAARETRRNNAIKDAVRESSMVFIVKWLFSTLQHCPENRLSDVAVLGLEVAGAYALWVEISLIANDSFLPLIVNYLCNADVRESAADCLNTILNKGMEPLAKVELVELVYNLLTSLQIWDTQLQAASVDFLVKLGNLLGVMGINLIDSYNTLFKANGCRSTGTTVAIMNAIDQKQTLLLLFLGNVDDDVSASVFEFVRGYFHLLKSKTVFTEVEVQLLGKYVTVFYDKLRFDSDYDFDHEGEDEACFREFRKQLKVIIENLIMVDRSLLCDQLVGIISQAFYNWRQLSFAHVEAALYLLYIMGESIPACLSQCSSDPEKQSTIEKLLLIMTKSEVHLHTHSAVTVQYFEISVRYEKFFLYHSEFISQVLTTFLTTSGLYHPDRKLRSRSAYLFSRFIKTMRSHLTPELTLEIYGAIRPLLTIEHSVESLKEALISEDDQLYLYEVVGVIILAGESSQQKRFDYMNQILTPLLEKCQNNILGLTNAAVPTWKEVWCRELTQIVAVVGRLSKAFTAQETMKTCGCVRLFVGALEEFVKAIDVTDGELRMELISAIRQYFHRLVVCLETEVLPLVPSVSHALLRDGSVRSVIEYIPLINQIITKLKKDVTPFLKQILPGLVSVVFEEVAQPLDENDETAYRDRIFLKKQYYQFLICIATNNLEEVFTTEDASILFRIIESVVHGSINFPERNTQKICFVFLKKLIEWWGENSGPDGFVQFMYDKIVSACFLAPSSPSFDANDAQSLLVINEIAACLKCIHEKRGEELIGYLGCHFLPKASMLQKEIEDLLRALKGSVKEFRTHLRVMFQKMKQGAINE